MRTSTKGFTLVELLVSIGIFTLITTVAVFNNSSFNGSLVLSNLAYEIGLSVRQAQFYGITVKQTSLDQTKFDSGYGIHFDMNDPSTYILFEDRKPPAGSPDHVYNGSSVADADIEIFRISKGNSISNVCVDGNCVNSSVDITFVRPHPDAYIRVNGDPLTYHAQANICVISKQGTKRKVVVESTGQISVGKDNPPPNQVCD